MKQERQLQDTKAKKRRKEELEAIEESAKKAGAMLLDHIIYDMMMRFDFWGVMGEGETHAMLFYEAEEDFPMPITEENDIIKILVYRDLTKKLEVKFSC